MIRVQGNQYELVENVKEGWVEEDFKGRYSDVLNKYDYIVGDWGYNQLRLKGFFDDQHRKSPSESKISSLPEYLYEYCNFGCSYFVIKKVKEKRKSS
ncbi:YutD family protein [Alteribacter populi]|uniref:YutD family protein n=1 Tax=Alteribacter populi TaxID=2011011 RepID=UPI000BBAD484|nr:YutD family protein [Alteribacter populi]